MNWLVGTAVMKIIWKIFHVKRVGGEIDIQEQDIEKWKTEDQPAEMAFLVSAAKRQKSEVRLRDLDPKEVELFKKAKQGEINNWLSTGTMKRIFRNQIPEDQILRCRWLLTWKPIEQPSPGEPDKKAKARRIVLGYLDPQLEEIPRDSPTMSKTSRMLVLQMISSEGWDLMSFDVKAAFLQGTQSGRTLGIEPVPELSEAMQLKPGEVCQLVKGAYGLVDAPYLWYKTLQAELVQLGFRTTPFDPCTFVLYDKASMKPQGIIGIHVDDGLCGATKSFWTNYNNWRPNILSEPRRWGISRLQVLICIKTLTRALCYPNPNMFETSNQLW